MGHPMSRGTGIKYMLVGGSMVAAIALVVDLHPLLPQHNRTAEPCQEVIAEKSFLSRDRLSQFLAVPEGTHQTELRQLMKAPYCRLADGTVKPGVTGPREAYPLEFDPKTWLVVLYEGDVYVGYTFSFRQ